MTMSQVWQMTKPPRFGNGSKTCPSTFTSKHQCIKSLMYRPTLAKISPVAKSANYSPIARLSQLTTSKEPDQWTPTFSTFATTWKSLASITFYGLKVYPFAPFTLFGALTEWSATTAPLYPWKVNYENPSKVFTYCHRLGECSPLFSNAKRTLTQ